MEKVNMKLPGFFLVPVVLVCLSGCGQRSGAFDDNT